MKKFSVFLGIFMLFAVGGIADDVKNTDNLDDEIQKIEKQNKLLRLKKEQEELKKSINDKSVSDEISKPQKPKPKPKSNKGWDFYGYIDLVSIRSIFFDNYNANSYDLVFSIGPSYGFTEWFKIGARVGVGYDLFNIRVKDENGAQIQAYKNNPSASAYLIKAEKNSFTIPVGIDAIFMLKPKLELLVGAEYDFGGILNSGMVYAGINAWKWLNIKVGYIIYSSASFDYTATLVDTYGRKKGTVNDAFKDSGASGWYASVGYFF